MQTAKFKNKFLITSVVALIGAGSSSCGVQSASTPGESLVKATHSESATASVKVNETLSFKASPFAIPFNKPTLEPLSKPINVTLQGKKLLATPYVKWASNRPGLLWVEVYLENTRPEAIENLKITVKNMKGANRFFDLTIDPFNERASSGGLELTRIAGEGMGKVVFGIPIDLAAVPTRGEVQFDIEVTGATSLNKPTHSSTISMSPDGLEVWSVVPDLGKTVVLNSATHTKIAELDTPGKPMSVTVSPDGKLALVAAAEGNKIFVIDTESHQVVQTLTEADGLGRELRHVVFSSVGRTAFVSGYVSDSVMRLDGDENGRFKVSNIIAVGRRPTGISVSPDGETVIVSHFLPRGPIVDNEAWISVISANPFQKVNETVIEDHFNLSGNVQCSVKGFSNFFRDLILGKLTPEDMTTEGAPSQLSGVFMNAAGTQAWVPGTRIAGTALPLERGPNADPAAKSFSEIRPGEFSPPFVFIFSTTQKHKVERLLVPGLERAVPKAYTECARYQTELEFVSRDIRTSNPKEQANRFLAFPHGEAALTEMGLVRSIAFTRGGRRALIVSHTSDEVAVYDASTLHPSTQKHFKLSGSNPTGIVVSNDGKKAFVNYENSPFVSVLDTSSYADPKRLPRPEFVPFEYKDVPDLPKTGTAFGSKLLVRHIEDVPDYPKLNEIAQIQVATTDPMSAEMRRGKILFSSANPDKYPVSASRNGACASCHPDGGSDGSAWMTMEGERRTMSLRGGVAGRGWLHISGTHQDIKEFAHTIVEERLGGKLTAEDETALAKYVAFGIPKLQGPVVNAEKALAGKALFDKNCAGCHSGEKFTSGKPDPTDPFGGGIAEGPKLFNIGTQVKTAFVGPGTFFEKVFDKRSAEVLKEIRGDRKLGAGDKAQQILDFRPRPERALGSFKAPSLINTFDYAVFFHTANISSLSEAVSKINERLGKTMSPAEEDSVVEYLKTL